MKGFATVRATVGLTLLLVATPAVAQNPPLNRNLGAFHIFGSRSVNLKNYTLLGACNVGVDCAKPSSNSDCGVLSQEDAFYADNSQVAGDNAKFTKPGASVWQLFSNEIDSPQNVTVRLGTDPLTPLPIIGDRDGDGVPSCRTVGGTCATDPGDLAIACAFPTPFPACDPSKPITVLGNADCTGVTDAVPGNGRCDLGPGTYGDLVVQNQGKVTFAGGAYVFCKVDIGKSTNTITNDPATIYTSGDVLVNNDSSLGQQCGDVTVLANGPGAMGFGRNSAITGFFCAPQRLLQLGHDNDLTGQFYANEVNADSNNRGRCCAPADDCACIDSFSPVVASVGTDVTLRGGCSLAGVTEVRICGIVAPITAKTATEVHVTVPAGATGACAVQVKSVSGTFHPAATLAVN